VLRLNDDIMVAVTDVRKHKRIIDSMRLMAEPTLAEISDLRKWKQHILVVLEKQTKESGKMICEITHLKSQCKESQKTHFNTETRLKEREEAFKKKLVEERGCRQDENRRLTTALCVKEGEVRQLNEGIMLAVTDARKHQRIIAAMRLMAEPTLSEISDLKDWKQQTLVVLEEQTKESEKMTSQIAHLNSQCQERQEKLLNTETKLKKREEAFKKKLTEERGCRQEENCRLRTLMSRK